MSWMPQPQHRITQMTFELKCHSREVAESKPIFGFSQRCCAIHYRMKGAAWQHGGREGWVCVYVSVTKKSDQIQFSLCMLFLFTVCGLHFHPPSERENCVKEGERVRDCVISMDLTTVGLGWLSGGLPPSLWCDAQGRLHMNGLQSATVFNGNGTFL